MALKDQRAGILTMSSVVGNEWLGRKFERDPKCVTTEIHKAFIYVKPLSENSCLLKMIINADPHLDYIPQKIINWGLKNVIGVFLRTI